LADSLLDFVGAPHIVSIRAEPTAWHVGLFMDELARHRATHKHLADAGRERAALRSMGRELDGARHDAEGKLARSKRSTD
jgi:hypothetical protein